MKREIEKGKLGGWRPNSGRKPGFIGFWKDKKRPNLKSLHLKKFHKKGKENYFAIHILKGENHPRWKGDKVGYSSLHSWVKRYLGTPETCEECGKTNLKGKYINWANISGKYKRELDDWKRLCKKCHHKFDNLSEKIWKKRRQQLVV